MRGSLIRTLLAAALVVMAAHAGAAQGGKAVLIRGATVLTVSGPNLENGSVLIRDGKIAAVGRDLPVPDGAEVVDAKGQYLMPGIIDCHSHIAVSGGVNEGTLSVTAMVGVGDVINPEDPDIYWDLAGGVTSANVLHGSANAIGGKNQVIKLRWGKDAEALKLAQAMPGIKFALGENPKRTGYTTGTRYPATRMGTEDVIRDAFNRAREYERRWAEYREKQASSTPALPPRRDLELEPLVEVMHGKRLVHCHCYREDEILMMMRVAEEFGFRVATFQHVLEGYKVAKEMAAHGVGGSTFSDWWAYKIEAYDAIPYNAAIMTRKGVVVSINSDDAEEARHLNQEAAKCVKYGGLTENEALRLVTLNPAKQLRIDAWVGSIEVGKDADLVLYDAHPLSPRGLPQRVWIDGAVYFDRDKDKERVAAAAETKRRLLAEEERESRASAGAGGPGRREGGGGRRGADAPPMTEAGQPEGRPEAPQPPPPHPERTRPADREEAANEVYAIRGARIYPVSGPVIESGTIVVSGGKIGAIGADVRIPAGAKVIEGKGLRVYPGMIDANTTLGLTEIGSIDETNDTTELGEFKPQLRAYDAIHPASEFLPVTRVNGVTTALSLPRGGIFSGQATLIDLDGWTVEEMAVRKSAGLVATLPSPSTGGGRRGFGGGQGAAPRSFADAKAEADRQLKRVSDLLDDARAYLQAKEAHGKEPSLPAVPHDEKLEALAPVLRREVPFLVSAGTKGAIRTAVEFAEKQKLRLVILGGRDAGKIAPYLKQHDVSVVYGPVQALPSSEDDPYDLPYATPGILAKAGVRFAIATGSSLDSRNLPFDAGNAAGSGLSEDEALRAVTLYPAQILGVADRLGSLEVGKAANLVVTDGDLLEIRTQVKQVFIHGRPIPMESKHTRLWEKYRDRK